MPDLKAFRSYSEQDVINLFAHTAVSVKKGTVVKINGTNGFQPVSSDNNSTPVDIAGYFNNDANLVSPRWSAVAKVTNVNNVTDKALGITLMDVQEVDENGEKLIFNPRKAAEKNVVIANHVVPVLTKGVVLYQASSTDMPTEASAGADVFFNATASLTTVSVTSAQKVGQLLGKPVAIAGGNTVAVVRFSF
jgi:hypothetical protein